MVNPENQQSVDEHEIEESDCVDQSNDDSSSVDGTSRRNTSSGNEAGLTERLTDILVDDGDGDLLIQRSDREDRVLQWLQALDMQFMGACRADERLKPLLKLNVSSGVAEDRLLAHLCQHFEPSEVGMLARCLCIPLVSVRVGKINKQGNFLCPTTTRGNLNLTLLPTSDLRISFIGDDGHTERLPTLSSDLQCAAVVIDEIPADKSGLSFLIKIPDAQIFYFWCSEKSKLLGRELLRKMKDLLKKKPSLAEFSGISESRLDCFATHLRAYLVGSTVTSSPASLSVSISSLDTSLVCQNAQFSLASSKTPRSRHYSSQGAKPNSLYQGSLSPRSSSFKEGLPRNLSSLRGSTREKFRRRGDGHLSYVDNLSFASQSTEDASSSSDSQKDDVPKVTGTHMFPSNFLESLGKSAGPPFLNPQSQVASMTSLFSPYYCWCPPVASTLQYTISPPLLPVSSTESLSLPPLSSLLSASLSSTLLGPQPPLNLAKIPSLDFPPLFPEPLVRLPFPMSTSQQIATFTPLMCDPIVHIPVIDFCSSGQAYLVSAGPAISNSIPSLHTKLVNPLIPETDSMVEKGARETLRLLISSSSQTKPQLIDVLPSVFTSADEKRSVFAAGSRGLYIGTRDVDVIANSIAAMELVSISERSIGGVFQACIGQGELVDHLKKPGGSCSDDQSSMFSREERGD